MAVFTPEERLRFEEEVDRVLTRFPEDQKGAALLEALHMAQDILGWVPEDIVPIIADKLCLPLVRVFEVRSFYTMFHLERPGRHMVEVCTNAACQALGAEEIVDTISRRFKVSPGETSAGGRLTLKSVECLGSCGTAPMLAHNREYVEEVDEEKLERLLSEIERS